MLLHRKQSSCGWRSPEVTRKWRNMTRSNPEVTSFHRNLPGSGCRMPKIRVYCAFHYLQGCNTHQEAVMWHEMTSRDLMWPEVTWKWCHLTGSHLEVAVEGRKLTYTVHFISYKDAARSRRQSLDRKWCHVTSGDWKWHGSDVISREVTWKWM